MARKVEPKNSCRVELDREMAARTPTLPDPKTTRAIILGAENFPECDKVRAENQRLGRPAFRGSANGFRDYLTSARPKGYGLPDSPDHIKNLFDAEANSTEQLKEIHNFLLQWKNETTDVLVYYVGHGEFDHRKNQYSLLVKATGAGWLRSATSLHPADLVDVLQGVCSAARIYLIVDACFAGRAGNTHQSAEDPTHPLDAVIPKGMATLCSSGPNDLSHAPESWPKTLFTTALLTVLEDGAEEITERLSFAKVYDLVGRRISDYHTNSRKEFEERRRTDPQAKDTQIPLVQPHLYCPDQSVGRIDTVPLFPNTRYSVAQPKRTTLIDEFERRWGKEGPDFAVRWLEEQIPSATASELLEVIRSLVSHKAAEGALALFACLGNPDEAVPNEAAAAIKQIGWDAITSAVLHRVEPGSDPKCVEVVLRGARAHKTDPSLLRFLETVVPLILTGWRQFADEAVIILDRKRLRLTEESFKTAFNSRSTAFRVEAGLGRGAITDAYRAARRINNQPVVIRVLQDRFRTHAATLQRFLDIGLRSLWMQSTNLMAVWDVVSPLTADESAYIVRQFVDGMSLRDYTQQIGPLNLIEAADLLWYIAGALRPYHDHDFCHGGVRPANIFIQKNRPFYLLGDPSLLLQTSNLETESIGVDAHRLRDDARYTAPEAFTSTPGPPADQYALGCVAFELFCGKPPFDATNRLLLYIDHVQKAPLVPSQCGSGAGPLADQIIARLLAKDPGNRYKTMDELQDALFDLRRSLRERETNPPPSPGPEPGPSPPSPSDDNPPPPPGPGPSNPPPHGSDPPPVSPQPKMADDAPPERQLQYNLSRRDQASLVEAPTVTASDWVTRAPRGVDQPNLRPPESVAGLTGSQDSGLGNPTIAPHTQWRDRPITQLGRYEIRRLLGQGGMGAVYLAHDPILRRDVAIKVIQPYVQLDSSVSRRFIREAQVLARLSHPNICPILDVGDWDGHLFITMRLISGLSLSQLLHNRTDILSIAWVIRLLKKVADAMAYVHTQGVVHRDLKPANIIIQDDDGEPIIMDFGIAHQWNDESERLTHQGSPIGTPAYMSPEQVFNSSQVGPASDVYSLGCLLYELLIGERQSAGDFHQILRQRLAGILPSPPSELRPDIPAELDALWRHMCAVNPQDRPLMEQVSAALASIRSPR